MESYFHSPTTVWRGRNYRRFELAFPVRLKYQTGSTTTEIDGVSKNISLGGLLVRSASPIPAETAVTFVLSVHAKHALRPVHLMGEGQVIRMEQEEAEEGFAVAVKCNAPFIDLEDYLPS